ncbi:MAG: indolepyruvate oxidoreductase subunit beta [Nitrospiraceae bacterium]|nr:MAG: indolepyruvate oxidoreductase subunit beta [Nitrospiraceae bacterium]
MNDRRGKNILICGVGGQGILLASEILSTAFMEAGFDVKQSEVHGMAQRGGSVVAHLRYGDKVYSPLIEPGTADIEVAFEMLESARYLRYLHKNSTVIVNTQKIFPPSVATGIEQYPEDILEKLTAKRLRVIPVNALTIAQHLGETRAVNMVLVGALSLLLPVPEKTFLGVLRNRVPARFLDVNRSAFMAGREAAGALQEVHKRR